MAKRSRSIVGSPLTPRLLRELGAYKRLPNTPDNFDSGAVWTNVYRIWTCHGYRRHNNRNRGFLKLQRLQREPGGSFPMIVDQEILNAGNITNILHADIACGAGVPAAVNEWRLTSRFARPGAKPDPRLVVKQVGRVKGDSIEVKTNGRDFQRAGGDGLTADWCLFDAVQRMSFDRSTASEFDMIEGLSLPKPGQRLSYHGPYEMELGGKKTTLQCFRQIGRGVLPFEYWVDEHHRLLLATTLSRAYILDDAAEQTTSRSKGGKR